MFPRFAIRNRLSNPDDPHREVNQPILQVKRSSLLHFAAFTLVFDPRALSAVKEYPIFNKEYPTPKACSATRAPLHFIIGNSLLVVGYSSLPCVTFILVFHSPAPSAEEEYPIFNEEYPTPKVSSATRALLHFIIGNPLLLVGFSSFSSATIPRRPARVRLLRSRRFLRIR